MHDPEELARESTRQVLSACLDGHASEPELDAICVAWRTDAHARATWHTYQLIGDVLRSDELAADPGHDEAFVQQLRQRLSAEPRVFPLNRIETPTRLRWPRAAAAVVAGFVAVAGVLVAMRQLGREPSSMELQAAAQSAQNGGADQAGAKGKLVRDAELERYFAAHRRVTLGSSVLMPGAVVRNVDAVSIEDR